MSTIDPSRRFQVVLGCLYPLVDPGNKRNMTRWSADTIDWLVQTGLGPVAAHCIRSSGGTVSNSASLYSSQLTSEVLSQELAQSMSEILQTLPPTLSPPVLLKGISTSEQYYPEPAMRTMRDIDVLVTKAELRDFEAHLRQLGYLQQSSNPADYYDTHHHTMPFQHPGTGIWIEVHTGLFPSRLAVSNDLVFTDKYIREQTVPSSYQGSNVLRLSAEMQLLYTAAHWGNEFKQLGNILPLIDAMLILDKELADLDFDWILSHSRNNNCGIYLYIMLSFLQRYGLIRLDDTFLEQLSRHHAINKLQSRLLHRIIRDYIFSGKPFGRLNSGNNIATIWHTLTRNYPAWRNIIAIPWNLLFPLDQDRRYSVRRLLGRLGSLFSTK